jgi:hypothetical protein
LKNDNKKKRNTTDETRLDVESYMYSSGRPYAGSCLFLVTRATIIGPEHGGPPTAALGPYHSAILLGGVEDTQAGSLSSAFAYWSQATCDVDALPRAKADSYPLCCFLYSNWNM